MNILDFPPGHAHDMFMRLDWRERMNLRFRPRGMATACCSNPSPRLEDGYLRCSNCNAYM